MAICKRYFKVAFTMTGDRSALFTRLRCKQWTCEYCAEKNARIWQYWLIERLPQISQDWYFVTLTAHPETRSEYASLQNIRTKIDRLIKRVKRVWGDDIEYVRVFEPHPTSKAVHVHFIMSGLTPYVVNGYSVKHQPMSIGVLTRKGHRGTWSTQTWFKKVCGELKMGHQAHVKRLEGQAEKTAFYITKYATKDQGSIHVPYLRHIQVTQGIGKPQFEENHNWQVAAYLTPDMIGHKTKVRDLDTGFIIDGDNYWEAHSMYPNTEHDI